VQWVYSSKNNQQLAERYDKWAEDYERDLKNGFGYVCPEHAVDYFARYVPLEADILDAGAGTGKVGELLFEKGYKHLSAMDLSSGMLEQARKKQVYTAFHQMVMGEQLKFPTDRFDAVISVGVLTEGHAPAGSLDKLVRITRPGGYIVYSLRTDLYEQAGFKEKNDSLLKSGKWALLEKGERFQGMPKGEPDVYLQAWVFQVKQP
jgi:SAM-dependent methyltransferase